MKKTQERPAFCLLVCPDSALLLEHIAEMLSAWTPAGGKWEKRVYWGDEPPGDKYWNDLDQQALFPASKAVIARRSNEWPAQVWKSLASVKDISSVDVWPLFCLEGAFERGQPKIPAYIQKSELYQHAEKKGWIWRMPPLVGAGLVKYARAQADRAGLKLSTQCMEQLCSSVLPDASSIRNEIEKLDLISRSRELAPELVVMDSGAPESDAFNCMRMLLSGNIAGVWKELQRSDDSLLFLLLALLAREFRLYWQILAGESPRLMPADAAARNAKARDLGFSGISSAFALLAEAEWNVKSGTMTPSQSLEKLVVAVATIFSGKSVAQ